MKGIHMFSFAMEIRMSGWLVGSLVGSRGAFKLLFFFLICLYFLEFLGFIFDFLSKVFFFFLIGFFDDGFLRGLVV